MLGLECRKFHDQIGNVNSLVCRTTQRRRWLIIILLSFSCITMAGFLWPAPKKPLAPVVMMNQLYAIPPAKVGFLDRIMPTSKAWAPLWRLRYALLGRNKDIMIDSTIIDLTASKPLMMLDLLPAKPDFSSSDRLQVW